MSQLVRSREDFNIGYGGVAFPGGANTYANPSHQATGMLTDSVGAWSVGEETKVGWGQIMI